jgi:type I restriction enzyme S subunit
MAIKKGYKQTDIGIIPEDWEIYMLGKIGTFSKGSGISRADANSGDISAIRYGEIYTCHNDYVKEFYSKISLQVASRAKKLKDGDLLFAGSGETKEDIGKCIAYSKEEVAYAGGDIIVLSPKQDYNPIFLGFLLNTPPIQKQKAAKGQGDAIVHISSNALSNILIPLPPTLTEQTAIATALFDIDALITALDKKIAKKKLIKQGAMQQLLKPQKGWQVKKLEDICYFLHGSGLSKSHISHHGRYKCLLYGELFTTYTEVIREVISKTDSLEGIDSQYGDILFPGSTTTTGIDLAKASAIFLNSVKLGGDVIILRSCFEFFN